MDANAVPPISRMLYREDEVIAALKWCVLRGRTAEAMFWTQEGVDSGLLPEVLGALLWCWLFGFGASHLGWLRSVRLILQRGAGAITNGDLLKLTTDLSRYSKTRGDASVIALLAAGLGQPPEREPDRVGAPTLPAGLEVSGTQLTAARALLQGKVRLAWSLLRAERADTVWPLLRALAVHKHPGLEEVLDLLSNAQSWLHAAGIWRPELAWPLRAVGFLAVSRPQGGGSSRLTWEMPTDPIPPDLMAAYGEWVAAPMRFRRIYSPPVECLYWFTARGSMRVNETTELELRDRLEDAMRGSRFWAKYVPEFTAPDIEREIFYTTFFPTDIPDEWSSKARQVSHGHGVVAVGNPDHRILFDRCLTRWLGALSSRSIWNGSPDAVRLLTERWGDPARRPRSLEEGFTAAYEEQGLQEAWAAALATWALDPVRRQLEPATVG